MKKLLSAAFLFAFLLAFAACSPTAELKTPKVPESGKTPPAESNIQIIVSTESNFSLDFPEMWIADNELHEDASISMAYAPKDIYMIVLEEAAEDFADGFTLADYIDILISNMLQSIDSPETTELREITVGDGLPALQYEIWGTVDNIKVKYQLTCVQSDTTFYQIIAWSLKSKFDSAVPVFNDVLMSTKMW